MSEHLILILSLLICTLFFVVISRLRVRNNESIIQSLKNIKNYTKREKKESYDLVRAIIINVSAGILSAIIFFEINLKIYENDFISLNDKILEDKIINKYPNYYEKIYEIEQLISFKKCTELLKDYKIEYQKLNYSKKRIYYYMCLNKENIINFTDNYFILFVIYIFAIIFILLLFIKKDNITTVLQKSSIDFYICIFAYSFVLALLFDNINSYISSVILVVVSLILIVLSKFKITAIGFFLGILITLYYYYPLF